MENTIELKNKSFKEQVAETKTNAFKGEATALYLLGHHYAQGVVCEKDYFKAYACYLMAKKKDDSNADRALTLGIVVEKIFPPKLQKNFLKELEKKADDGDYEAQKLLILAYDENKIVKVDKEKVFYWNNKLAEQGDKPGLYGVGLSYLKGHGVERDEVKGIEIITKFAEQDCLTAIRELARFYYFGGRLIAQDYEKSTYWYKKAKKMGCTYADGWLNDISRIKKYLALGYKYYYGKGVEQDYEKAYEHWYKAKLRASVEARYNIGVMYAKGQYVEQDYKRAYNFIVDGAKGSDAMARIHALKFEISRILALEFEIKENLKGK